MCRRLLRNARISRVRSKTDSLGSLGLQTTYIILYIYPPMAWLGAEEEKSARGNRGIYYTTVYSRCIVHLNRCIRIALHCVALSLRNAPSKQRAMCRSSLGFSHGWAKTRFGDTTTPLTSARRTSLTSRNEVAFIEPRINTPIIVTVIMSLHSGIAPGRVPLHSWE